MPAWSESIVISAYEFALRGDELFEMLDRKAGPQGQSPKRATTPQGPQGVSGPSSPRTEPRPSGLRLLSDSPSEVPAHHLSESVTARIP